jgi:rhamnulokinase
MSEVPHPTQPPSQPDDPRASIAVDLGAESCRVSLLRWVNGEPRISLVHRFPNGPIRHADNSARWPLRNIEAGVDEGMRRCAELAPEGIRSVAVDGWAVDYVRVDKFGKPLDEPFCYRDERNLASEQHLHTLISPERLIELTGVQQLSINTLYQLHADRLANLPPGRRWLNLPEYMLTRWGAEPVAEFSNATHTQLIDLYGRIWNHEIFDAAGLDPACAPRIVPSGTLLGKLEGPLTDLPAFRDTDLIAPAAHDTASAIAGIPAHGEDWAYISSGTWSLVGALTYHPQNSLGARADNFTNLGAVGGATCFHKNVNGMWLIRQCMDAWAEAGKSWTIEDLLTAARNLPPPGHLLTVDAPPLLLVGHMPERINAQRSAAGLPAMNESPDGAPAMVSLILHSLAARYAQVLARVQHHTGKQLKRLFIVGGGSRNTLLNELTAKATGLTVYCGSAESSTIGNFAVQLAVLEGHSSSESRAFGDDVATWAAKLSPEVLP